MNSDIFEFTEDWTTCWKKGDRLKRSDRPQLALTAVEAGYAKVIKAPPRNKMISAAEKEK